MNTMFRNIVLHERSFYKNLTQLKNATHDTSCCLRRSLDHHFTPVRFESNAISNRRNDVLSKYPTIKNIKEPLQRPSQSMTPEALFLLIFPITTFGLGTWQIFRRRTKLQKIELLKMRTEELPIDFPEDLSDIRILEYRKVRVKGTFDHSKEIKLGPRPLMSDESERQTGGIFSMDSTNKHGFLIITPFIISGTGQRILVNRGWVSSKTVKPSQRLQGQIQGEQELIGVVRKQENRPVFSQNMPSKGIYHYRDIKTMAEQLDTLPIFLDATKESTVPGGPIGGQTNFHLRNEHFSYIITWYSLSAITAYMWYKAHTKKRRLF